MKIGLIFGTRPEIIKLAPVVKQCQRLKVPFFTIHSGQHYSYEMDELFFEELNLPKPEYNLVAGSGNHGEQTGKILQYLEPILQKEQPTVVLVQGDTNTTLAGALAAVKLHIPLGHIEAGIRSFDRKMPEEINRVAVDHIANYLFTPTKKAAINLKNEGIEGKQVLVTGNTVVDALYYIRDSAKKRSAVLTKMQLVSNQYWVLTLHRSENVDNQEKLTQILTTLQALSDKYAATIIWPVHPRTERRLHEYRLQKRLHDITNIQVIDPLGLHDFLQLQAQAQLILTDSGGIQEESCILRVPCVTLRDTTERPESVEVGANIIAGIETKSVLTAVATMLKVKRNWPNPFGDGTAAEKIVDYLIKV